jgi:type IV secretory pathway VirB2 component (pilin)
MHPKLVRIILADWGHGYLRVDNSKLSLTRFLSTRKAARMSEENPQMWEALNQLHVVDSSAANRGVDRASRDLYLNLGGPIPMIVLVIANIALGIVLARHGRAEYAWLALCLVATGSILYFVNCVCVYYNDRYVLPLFVCNIAAWGIQLGRFTDDRCS